MTQIRTEFDAKPIPVRQYDWCATYEGYEPGDPCGWGQTEADAIANLKKQSGPPCPQCGSEYSEEYGYCHQCREYVA